MANTTVHVTDPSTALLISVALIVLATVLFLTLRPNSTATQTQAAATASTPSTPSTTTPSSATSSDQQPSTTDTESPSSTSPRRYVTDPFRTEHPEFWKPRNLDSPYIPLGHSPMYPFMPIVPVIDYPTTYPLPVRDLYNRDPELFCRDPFSAACHTAYWRDWPHSAPHHRDRHHPNNGNTITINNTNTIKAGRVHSSSSSSSTPPQRGSMVSMLKALM